MTLLTRHLDAGWHEVWHGTKRVAEKFYAQPAATGTVLREEADTQDELHQRIDLRESQLSNDQSIVTWPQGARVTDAEHQAAQILGTAPTPAKPSVPVSNGPTSEELDTQMRVAEHVATPVVSEAPLSDEERARIVAEEAALEASLAASQNVTE